MSRTVRKAVFPVAGFGTRFLPATKAMPKELLPFVKECEYRLIIKRPVTIRAVTLCFTPLAFQTTHEPYCIFS